MYHNSEQRRNSIEACWDCRDECQKTLYNISLEMGGSHVEEQHVKLMLDCIAICQTAADFITRHSSMSAEIANVCAKICEACAESCEHSGGAEMKRCAEACRLCAKHCVGSRDDSKPVAA